MSVARSLRLTRDDIGWRPFFVMGVFVAALFMVVNAFSGGPLLTDVQVWGLVIGIPGARVFVEVWVRFVEPRDLNGWTIAIMGFGLVGVSAV